MTQAFSEAALLSLSKDTEVTLTGQVRGKVWANDQTKSGTYKHKWTLALDGGGTVTCTLWGAHGKPPEWPAPAEGAWMTVEGKVSNWQNKAGVSIFKAPHYLPGPPDQGQPPPAQATAPAAAPSPAPQAQTGLAASCKTVGAACQLLADIYSNLHRKLPEVPPEQIASLSATVWIQAWKSNLTDDQGVPF